MERLYTLLRMALDGIEAWFETHRDLAGRVVAPLCIVIFMCIGFIFLFKSISRP